MLWVNIVGSCDFKIAKSDSKKKEIIMNLQMDKLYGKLYSTDKIIML